MSTGRRNDGSSLSLAKSTRYASQFCFPSSLSTPVLGSDLFAKSAAVSGFESRDERIVKGDWSDDRMVFSSGKKQDGNRCRNEFDRGIWREPIPLFYACFGEEAPHHKTAQCLVNV